MKVIIFAGGVGKRLWPVSRKVQPKQFQRIYGDETSLENSFNSIKLKFSIEDIYVSTGEEYVDEVLKTLPTLPPDNIIVEPMSKDTGPAVTYAMMKINMKFPHEPVLIRWQNSIIKKPDVFKRALDEAEILFNTGKAKFVYLAVPAKFSNTNVGYINATYESKGVVNADFEIRQFVKFTEKPNAELAVKYFRDPNYFWNPGCYITTPSFVLDSVKTQNRELYESFIEPISNCLGSNEEAGVVQECFEKVKKESIDYALWEKLSNDGVKVITTDYDWHYVSTWADIKSALVDKVEDNFTKGDVYLNSVIDSVVANFSQDRLVVVSDLEGVVVVCTDDAVLVLPKDKAAKVKDIVGELENEGKDKFL